MPLRLLRTNSVFSRVDHYKLLNHISTEPNFRWCLREGCPNGELYEVDDPHIMCTACGYEMCFLHQTAWHDGLTCGEQDNMRDHGDPNFRGTQYEIQRTTRPCPGCRIPIEKNAGCSHMHCQFGDSSGDPFSRY